MADLADYSFGRIRVDGQVETRDLIVLPNRVVRDWRRENGHALVLTDLEAVLTELPERLVVGTGAYGRLRPDPSALERLRERGVAVESLPTGQAVRRYASSTRLAALWRCT